MYYCSILLADQELRGALFSLYKRNACTDQFEIIYISYIIILMYQNQVYFRVISYRSNIYKSSNVFIQAMQFLTHHSKMKSNVSSSIKYCIIKFFKYNSAYKRRRCQYHSIIMYVVILMKVRQYKSYQWVNKRLMQCGRNLAVATICGVINMLKCFMKRPVANDGRIHYHQLQA